MLARGTALRSVAGAVVALALSAPARAQLLERQVLVVYDSRIVDSLRVSEYYAGSAKVPGGVGGQIGSRPGVRVLDISTLSGGGVFPFTADITHPDFRTRIRNPLRTYLTTNSLARSVRCIVLTKGMPHRITDTDLPTAGDFPGNAQAEFNGADATFSSVDSELTMLWQNIENTENGNAGDSRLDGCIVNPYHRSSLPINAFTTQFIQGAKSIGQATLPTGTIWQSTIANQQFRLTPGDIVLVCRLDAPTSPTGEPTQHVRNIIDRARNLVIDTANAAIILDESGGNGLATADFAGDGEFDNDGPVQTNAGDDYELTRDEMLADGRYLASNVLYNHLTGASNFYVGPLVNFGSGNVVSTPVVLLTHYGANHTGIPGGNAFFLYATSFNYAPGAIFNTAESYNGRDYGGLGQGSVTQQQSSLFLSSGGTFAIGNVYEPFSFSLADSQFLSRNFLLGRLTWAEAAYTAVPCLSWQQIVVGDPLARVVRSQEDRNADQRLDIEDLYAFVAAPVDINRDSAVNATDTAVLVNSVRGTTIEAAEMMNLRR